MNIPERPKATDRARQELSKTSQVKEKIVDSWNRHCPFESLKIKPKVGE